MFQISSCEYYKINVTCDSLFDPALTSLFAVKKLLAHVFQRRKKPFKRSLVYRDGVPEGSFPRVRNVEVQSIRDGYHDYVRENNYAAPCES